MDLKKHAPEWNPTKIIGDSGLGSGRAGTSIFRNIDARVLLPSAFVVILALSATTRWYVPGTVFVVVALITMYTVHSRKSYLKLLMYPITIALFLLVVQAYTYGSTVVLTVIWPVYAEGIASGWLLAMRVLASVSILLLLVESKSQLELIEALRWFKMPVEMRNLMSLMFRYVSVISEEFTTMFHAQQARLGYSAKLSWYKKINNLATIAGMLLIRSYDRSYRVMMSMMARGYTQNVDMGGKFERFARKDYMFAAFALVIIAGIVLVGAVS
jgi:cobalt/nickel transport system permease protein